MSALDLFNDVSTKNINYYNNKKSVFQTEITTLETENTNLTALDVKYTSLITNKLEQNSSKISILNSKIAEIDELISKINNVQTLEDDKKTFLFSILELSDMSASTFLNISIDRHDEIYTRCLAVFDDNNVVNDIKVILYNEILMDELKNLNTNVENRSQFRIISFT